MGLISKAILAGGAFYAYKQITKSQELRNSQQNLQQETDPSQFRDQGDYSLGQEGSHHNGGKLVDGLVQLAQEFMGKSR